MAENTHIGLSHQVALQRQMDIVANNIANVNTTGFKAQHILFSEYLNAPDGTKTVQAKNTYRDLSQGALKPTYNELDFSVQGEGYFAVQTPKGTQYTRNGSFSLNGSGVLVTKAGYPVLGDDGNPLTVPSGAARITADSTGVLTSEQGPIGTLKLATFDNQQMIKPIGNSLYDAESALEKAVEKPHIMQGMLESSNVNAIAELTAMDKITSAYQSAQNQQTSDHQRAESMIQILTKLET
jgi:flagellar basal-body rod protein FlgF